MNVLKSVIGLSLIASFSALAQSPGGLFVEPLLTYERGVSDVDLPEPAGSSESEMSGFGVGARIGVHVHSAVFLGLDGRYSMPVYTNDDTNIDTRARAYNLGPVVGVQMPTELGVRVWGNYIMAGELDIERDQGIDLKFKDASGYRIGAGVKLSMVSVNLEYQVINYSDTEVRNAGFFTGTTNQVDAADQSYILSVSFPFAL